LSRISGRYALATAAVLVVGLPAGALASGEGHSLIAGKRNPANGSLTSETQVIASNGTYGTRQSNKGSGGGAIYGCRSATGHEPCIRSNNLNTGRAFEFATDGNEAGRITTKDASGKPFTTTATGVATGLNADRVDSHDASDFALNTDVLSAIVTDATATAPAGVTGRGEPKVAKSGAAFVVTFNKDVSKCSYTASPTGAAAAVSPGVSPTPNAPNAVTVNFDTGAAGATPTTSSFHLQVIC
jgi:hypothetical protein